MSTVERLGGRLRVDGKFFREGSTKFHVKGVTYGPFAPNAEAGTFAGEAQTEQDFRQIKELGANVLRVYYVPPRWFLDLAHGHGLKVLVDIPWPKHLCFLDAQALRGQALEAVRDAATRCKDHPSLFAFSVVNEIPAEIVRWSGPRSIERFIDELVAAAKEIDPGCLCTFASFPPTEFLKPERIDFISFNVYLHEHKALEGYLSRLQTLAGSKPLVLSELGMDSLREGEPRQAEHLASQIELVFRRGLAGAIVFSYTDDWFRGGSRIEDWAFGVTTQERRPKASFAAVQRAFAAAPYFPLRTYPKVSVVVASYNGASTLEPCLLSLRQLNYPNYELILVDDGSTDSTGSIAQRLPEVRTIRQSNCGLSAARNRGIAAAAGEIIAFTDADCRADEDWLYYLVSDLLEGDYMGVGGHNLLPHDDSWVAAAVMVSPGGPAHVMLTDTEAEHIPGCNMAFYKSALEQIGGFDPVFRKAGDDVDVCWRLQQQGYKIGFSPAGFVWHYRRSTVRAYLRQQNGYGEAEALLLRKHPQYFNSAGRSRWAGRIYGSAQIGILLERSIIYHGLFGSGAFQRLYTPSPSSLLMLVTSLEYHLVVTVPLLLLALMISWLWPVALTSLGLSLAVCIVAAAQAHIEHVNRSVYSRPLVALLFFLQPLERGLARYGSQLKLRPTQHPKAANTHQLPAAENELITYWSDGSTDRYTFLRAILDWMDLQKWQVRADTGWAEYDLEVLEARWGRLRLLTAAEYLEQGRVIVRCRLKTQWSLAANIVFWGLLGTEVVIAALLGPKQPWIWMVLLTIPVLGWVLEYQQARLRMMVAALIYEVAQQRKMVKIARTRQSDFREEASKSQNIGVAGELVNAPANR